LAFSVSDAFDPDQLEVLDAAGGTVAAGRIDWQFPGPLAPGASGTLVVRMRIKGGVVSPAVIDNTASIAIADLADPTMARVTVGSKTYLPYTGMEMRLLVLLAAVLGVAGLALRRVARNQA
jgi:hypothetical protein